MKRLRHVLVVSLLLAAACSNPKTTPPVAAPSAKPIAASGNVTVDVYFTDKNRFAVGTEPYEVKVQRTIPAPASLPEAVLAQLFLGPTEAETNQGLTLVSSGATGCSKFVLRNGVAHVHLTGKCGSKGASYTIVNVIGANLAQFPEIKAVKIFDENGNTENPVGDSSSIPTSLEP